MLLAASVPLAAPVAAQTAGPGDPEAERQANSARRQEVESSLQAAQASDEDLQRELAQLDVDIQAGEARATAARAQQAAAERQVGELQGQVRQAEGEAAEARAEAARQAVRAYMRPAGETASEVLAARDPQQLGKMKALVGDLAEHNQRIVQSRQVAESLLRQRRAEAERAESRAHEAADRARCELDATEARRQERERVRAELQQRIEALKAESDELAAQDQKLRAIIAERQRLAAEAAARAEAAGRARAQAEAAQRFAAPSSPAPGSASSGTAARSSNGRFSWPLSGSFNSPFGPRDGGFHPGIDLGAVTGTPIHAAGAGTVIYASWMDGYGNFVMIDHGAGLVTAYGHQSQIASSVGQYVDQGEVIGYVGSTGRSTGPHLHFEVRLNGAAVNPLGYLP